MEIEEPIPNYDFSIPFETRGLVLVQQGHQMITYECNISLQWEDIVVVNQFYLENMLPHDRRPKTSIKTKYADYTVLVAYETVRDAWFEYKRYIKRADTIFKLN